MQETNLYTVTIPPLIRSLEVLERLIERAEAHAKSKKTERLDFEESLLQSRLVFDQFPFIRQVQIACDNAKGAAARLGGLDIPKFDDTEKTFAELAERVRKTALFLKTVRQEDIAGTEGIRVSLPFWGGKSVSGFEYVTTFLLPNFYFHVSTAYNILRKNGIALGKRDYLGPLPFSD